MGEEAVGKTTFVKCLQKKSNKTNCTSNISTDGINISDVILTDSSAVNQDHFDSSLPIHCRVWDFGMINIILLIIIIIIIIIIILTILIIIINFIYYLLFIIYYYYNRFNNGKLLKISKNSIKNNNSINNKIKNNNNR